MAIGQAGWQSCLVLFGLSWYWYSFVTALIIAIILFAGVGYLVHRMGLNMFGVNRIVEHQRRTTYHTCIGCGQAVKEVTEKR